MPALIRRFDAVEANESVTLTGAPMREFLYVDDLGEACIRLGTPSPLPGEPVYLNVGTGIDLSIRELAESSRVDGLSGRNTMG